jgi:hypothetical protein
MSAFTIGSGQIKTATHQGKVIPIFDITAAEKNRRYGVALKKVTPRAFKYFPKLAPELRNMILDYAIADLPARVISVYSIRLAMKKHKVFVPREKKVLEVRCSDIKVARAYADVPTILQVNRDARSLGLRTYARDFGPNLFNWNKQGVYFDFKKDLLNFEDEASIHLLFDCSISSHNSWRPASEHFCFCTPPDELLMKADMENKVEQIMIPKNNIHPRERVIGMGALRPIVLSKSTAEYSRGMNEFRDWLERDFEEMRGTGAPLPKSSSSAKRK